jgi:hypothetical protein
MSDSYEKTVVLDKSDVPASIRGTPQPPAKKPVAEKPRQDDRDNPEIDPSDTAWLS